LTSTNSADENTFVNPQNVVPKDSELGKVSSPFDYRFVPYSVTILHLKP
jgi:alpha-L-arabinofuranosidase